MPLVIQSSFRVHSEFIQLVDQFVEASKDPVKLIYKTDPFNDESLYTGFQNLPDRKARIRINTLIDCEAIAEVDFNARHLKGNGVVEEMSASR